MFFAIFPIVIFVDEGVIVQDIFGVLGMILLTIISTPMILTAYQALSRYDAPKILTEAELREMVERTHFVECEAIGHTEQEGSTT